VKQAADRSLPLALPVLNLPASPDAQDLVDFVRAMWKAEKAAAQPVGALSRQQRCFGERQTEKQWHRDLNRPVWRSGR